MAFNVERSDGARTLARPEDADGALNNKFFVIVGEGYEYTVRFSRNEAPLGAYHLSWQTEEIGDLSPVVRFANLGSGCRLEFGTRATSLAQLRSQTTTAYYTSGTDLYVKARATDRTPFSTSRFGQNAVGALDILCNR
jgi:hypothetical protein